MSSVDLQACWEEEPDNRPDFESIIADLRGMLRCTAATRKRSQALTGDCNLAPNVISMHCLWFTRCSVIRKAPYAACAQQTVG